MRLINIVITICITNSGRVISVRAITMVVIITLRVTCVLIIRIDIRIRMFRLSMIVLTSRRIILPLSVVKHIISIRTISRDAAL